MKNIFIYPLTARVKNLKFVNPYLDDLVDSLGHHFYIVNKENPSAMGVFGLYKYLYKTNYVLFNWIEKLPENKAGVVQTIGFFLLLPLFRLFNIKIIWTMHNKLTHAKKHQRISNAIFKAMIRRSDFILTHSSEGITFGDSLIKGSRKKIYYFPHPVKDRRSRKTINKKYDILIWGSLSPYKGIDQFLEYLHSKRLADKYKILITGTASSDDYFEKLSSFKTKSIEINNEFIEDSTLQQINEESKLVLFSYSKASILSSGALMDSIGFGADIIGPHVGAFADLAKDKIVETFHNFDELIQKIDLKLENKKTQEDKSNTELFLKGNSWDKYAENVYTLLSE